MQRPRGWLEGWPLLGVLAAPSAAGLAVAWLLGPGGEEGVRLLIRTSARISVMLFLLAFTARAIRQLWPVPGTAWLLRNRRSVGVAFACVHGLHLAAIATLAVGWSDSFFATEGRPGPIVGGGIAYLLITLMAATSNDRAVAALGPQRWKRLHRFGAHYIWALFTFANARRIPTGAGYAALTLVLTAALGLRLAVAARVRRMPAARAPA